MRIDDAEWSSQAARRAHNPEVGGSNPSSATIPKKSECKKPDGELTPQVRGDFLYIT